MISVLIADDQPLVRAGLRTVLDRAEDIRVTGEASDGAQAVQQAQLLTPNVVLMDVRMPGMDGIEATRQIVATPALADTRVIVVTTFKQDEYIQGALRAGASGFLLKDAEPDELRHAVRVVAAGEALLAPSVTRRLIATFTRQVAAPAVDRDRLAQLTERERDVVALVGRGFSNDEIAEQLVISPATAKTHVSHALTKLAARDRAQLVIFAYQAGLV
ncbi:MAG: DNA-binding response regulator [Actinobacteria bacterium 69-20]|nr:response regulator transcription factor [Actinomycetota bacterium]OJV27619.1 MAG: DNA-binding response regulator [Actinobacteria bacterium 69-20]